MLYHAVYTDTWWWYLPCGPFAVDIDDDDDDEILSSPTNEFFEEKKFLMELEASRPEEADDKDDNDEDDNVITELEVSIHLWQLKRNRCCDFS